MPPGLPVTQRQQRTPGFMPLAPLLTRSKLPATLRQKLIGNKNGSNIMKTKVNIF